MKIQFKSNLTPTQLSNLSLSAASKRAEVMEIKQLELDLWSSLATAVEFPQTADFYQLCCALEREVGQQPMTEQLEIAAEGLQWLSRLYAARVDLLLSEWERRYNPTEPVVDLESCVRLFVQSLHLNVADLFESAEPVCYLLNDN